MPKTSVAAIIAAVIVIQRIGPIHPASAQTAAQPTTERPAGEVVVVGRPSVPRDVASNFIRRIAPHPRGGQYSRWNEPVCTAVSGLPDVMARLIEDKVKSESSAAGIHAARGDCHANVIVIFTRDGRKFMDTLVRRRPTILTGMTTGDQRYLLTSAAPIRWWHNVRLEGSNGEQPSLSSTAIAQTDIPRGNGVYLDTYSSSLIDTKIRMSLDSIVIVVDADATAGRTLRQVAAFIAMVGLAQIDVGQSTEGLPSILSLFSKIDTPDQPSDLSRWDKAYLAALYAVPANRNGEQQRGMMIAAMQDYSPNLRLKGKP